MLWVYGASRDGKSVITWYQPYMCRKTTCCHALQTDYSQGASSGILQNEQEIRQGSEQLRGFFLVGGKLSKHDTGIASPD